MEITENIYFIFTGISLVLSASCLSRDYGNGGTVCVCNKHHCDTIDPVSKIQQGSYLKYTSNKDGLRFKKKTGVFKNADSNNKIIINANETFQTIYGFGGAFTDSTGINIMSLDGEVREKLMR